MMEAGLFEAALFTAFLCWLFSERVLVMVDVMSARVQRTACKMLGAGEPSGEAELRRAAQRRLRQLQRQKQQRDNNDNELYKQHRIELLLSMKEKPLQAPMPPDLRANNLPLGLACDQCTPNSRESWVSGRHNRSRVIDIYKIGRDMASFEGFFSKRFCDLVLAYGVTTIKCENQPVAESIFQDERLQQAIERTTQEEMAKAKEDDREKSIAMATIRKQVEKRAREILSNMTPAFNFIILGVTSWIMHKILPRIVPGGVAIRAEAVSRLRSVAAGLGGNVPLIIVPLHRSHLDYMLLSSVFVNCNLKPPLVAGGDNLNIPFFGWMLRCLGAFFIRRKVDGSQNQRDHVYRATLKAYLFQCLQANHNIEFFIEGGRTRSGKPQLPKGGILSVIVDAYIEGSIEDAMLVPASLNYEKLVDGNFVREQLGMPKKMENFWVALKGIWGMLNSNFGCVRIDYNQPYSLRELVRSFQQKNYHRKYLEPMLEYPLMDGVSLQQLSHKRQISSNQSCSSLLGDDMSPDHLGLVEAIARHIVYDASKTTAIMSTNVVCWCLLNQFREGCSLGELVASVEKLCGRLLSDGRDLGFTGETVDIVNHAIDLLGPGLIKRERDSNVIRIRPIILLPNVIELSYYSSCILPHYALQAIVVTASEVLAKSSQTFSQSSLVAESLCLCEVMSQEFLLAPPCRRLNDCIIDTINDLAQMELLQSLEQNGGKLWGWNGGFELDTNDDDDDDASRYVEKIYTLVDSSEARKERRYLCNSLQPLIEAYVVTSYWLTHSDLITQSSEEPTHVTEREFVQTIVREMTTAVEQGRLPYGEALSTEAIINCVRLHKQWGVVDMALQGRERIITMNADFLTASRLQSVHALVSRFKLDSSN